MDINQKESLAKKKKHFVQTKIENLEQRVSRKKLAVILTIVLTTATTILLFLIFLSGNARETKATYKDNSLKKKIPGFENTSFVAKALRRIGLLKENETKLKIRREVEKQETLEEVIIKTLEKEESKPEEERDQDLIDFCYFLQSFEKFHSQTQREKILFLKTIIKALQRRKNRKEEKIEFIFLNEKYNFLKIIKNNNKTLFQIFYENSKPNMGKINYILFNLNVTLKNKNNFQLSQRIKKIEQEYLNLEILLKKDYLKDINSHLIKLFEHMKKKFLKEQQTITKKDKNNHNKEEIITRLYYEIANNNNKFFNLIEQDNALKQYFTNLKNNKKELKDIEEKSTNQFTRRLQQLRFNFLKTFTSQKSLFRGYTNQKHKALAKQFDKYYNNAFQKFKENIKAGVPRDKVKVFLTFDEQNHFLKEIEFTA